jgi:hypothetical protein
MLPQHYPATAVCTNVIVSTCSIIASNCCVTYPDALLVLNLSNDLDVSACWVRAQHLSDVVNIRALFWYEMSGAHGMTALAE